jgi:hypothetical protein
VIEHKKDGRINSELKLGAGPVKDHGSFAFSLLYEFLACPRLLHGSKISCKGRHVYMYIV